MAGIHYAANWKGARGLNGRFVAGAQAMLRDTVAEQGKRLQEIARREAPISNPANVPPDSGHRPGMLREGIKVEVQTGGSGSVTTAVLTSDAEYTVFVRKGHGVIVPTRPGGMLRFFYRGRWVYTRRVRAVAPNDFVERAVRAWEPEARAVLGRLVVQMGSTLFE